MQDARTYAQVEIMDENGWKPWMPLGDEDDRVAQRLMGLRRMARHHGTFVGTPAADVFEDEEELTFLLEVPGVDLEQIQVDVGDGALHISGERPISAENVTYHALELEYGPFQRSFMLPSDADPHSVSAVLKNGLLRVTLRRKPKTNRRILPE
jgi:HSP20 family protein